MSTLTLPIIAGKRYKRRDGADVVATEPTAYWQGADGPYICVALPGENPEESRYNVFAISGVVYTGEVHVNDLIADVEEVVEETKFRGRLTLPIKPFTYYFRRDGEIIKTGDMDDKYLPITLPGEERTLSRSERLVFPSTGRINTVGGDDSPRDLVADVIHSKSVFLLQEYAEDAVKHEKPWEVWQCNQNGKWRDCTAPITFFDDIEYRRKPAPEKIKFGDVEINGPLREEPEQGEPYFLSDASLEKLYNRHTWDGIAIEKIWLERGFLFKTMEDASAHAQIVIDQLKVKN